jgi:hypothetical protein
VTAAAQIARLAWSFPVLSPHLRELAIGTDGTGWSARRFDSHLARATLSGSGSWAAAAFVLNVWNDSLEWKCGPFNLGNAMRRWDNGHRAAFAAWAMNPVLP